MKMENKLNITETIIEAAKLGVKNILHLLIAVILYGLTIWIPYLNVGTTIGMYKLIVLLSKGKMADPLSMFDKENFEKIGDFFLFQGLQTIGITAAMIFMFVPAMIMSIAWQFAIYFLIDKGTSPLKSLSLSYDATYGEKWRIFGALAVFGILVSILTALFAWIPKVGFIFVILIVIAASAAYVALIAVMYRHFAEKADAILAGKPACCCKAEAPAEAPAVEEPAAEEPKAEEIENKE